MFIHSSINGHLSGLLLLATVNNAAGNTGIYISIQFPPLHFLGHASTSRIAGSHGNSLNVFEEPSYYFSAVAVSLTFRPATHMNLDFFTSFPSLVILFLFSK